jgi:hypothetical protein
VNANTASLPCDDHLPHAPKTPSACPLRPADTIVYSTILRGDEAGFHVLLAGAARFQSVRPMLGCHRGAKNMSTLAIHAGIAIHGKGRSGIAKA